MKKILLLIISLFILNISVYSNDTHNNRFIIKFKSNTAELLKWQASGRNSEIEALRSIVGNHKIKPYVDNKLLKMVKKHFDNYYLLNYNSIGNSLERIAYVEIEANDNLPYLVKKIEKLDFIQYAELEPISKLNDIPNDPMIGMQYYLQKIHAIEAWELLDSTKIITVGIVDTGIDYTHEDIKDNIYNNPGEMGLDSNNADKSTNGIDDDANGYIDDWRGWDFSASSDTIDGEDNDPMPGNLHGTHVGGTIGAIINNSIGISPVAKFVKLMPVKAAADDSESKTMSNSYQALLYAALKGAKVINCSWGSTSKSATEQEMVKTAQAAGAIIVAAAGNDQSYVEQYPASYPEVFSVAATDSSDRKAYFSNYHSTIDIAAPGVDIWATIPENGYRYLDGTSMATPIVAAVTAMTINKFPDYTPIQVQEHIKACSDNIDTLDYAYAGKIGKGRINAYKALSTSNAKSLIINHYEFFETEPDFVYAPEEEVILKISLKNILSNMENFSAKAFTDYFMFSPKFTKDSAFFGSLATNEISDTLDFVFQIPWDAGIDGDYEIKIKIEGDDYKSIFSIPITVNQSYRTMSENNITATLNSRGNLGFNDYPTNKQGFGFKYKNQASILFEGALMAATSPMQMSDVARASYQMMQSRDFGFDKAIEAKSKSHTFVKFYDIADSTKCGVAINQNAYQFKDNGLENILILDFDVTNISDRFLDSLFVGYFFDWDIINSHKNYTYYDKKNNIGITQLSGSDTTTIIGVAFLDSKKTNFRAIDNDGSSSDNFGIYDGFDNYEKWTSLSSGLQRSKSSITDVSMVISNGPHKLPISDTLKLTMIISADTNLISMSNSIINARKVLSKMSEFKSRPLFSNNLEILNVYPNPASTSLNALIQLPEAGNYKLYISDINGKIKKDILEGKSSSGLKKIFQIDIKELSQGTYILVLEHNGKQDTANFVKLELN